MKWPTRGLIVLKDVIDVVVGDVADMQVVENLSEAKFGLDTSPAQVIKGVAVAAFDVGQPRFQCRDTTFQCLNRCHAS